MVTKEKLLSREDMQYAQSHHGIHLLPGNKPGMTYDAAYGTSGVIPALVTTAFYPSIIRQVLAAMKFEEIARPMISGKFEDTDVLFMRSNLGGDTRPYTDYSYDGSADANFTFLDRSVYRAQTNINMGDLEVAMASRMNGAFDYDLMAQKRGSAAYALAKTMNSIGFLGMAGMNNYGLLNDPSLAATIALPTGAAGSTLWSSKTPYEIAKDILLMFSDIISRAGGNIDVGSTSLNWVLVVSPQASVWLATPNPTFMNNTPFSYLQQTFPNLRVVSAPEYQVGNGSTGNYAQLILTEWAGTPTVFNLTTYRFMDHGLVRDISAFKGKASAASAGAGVVYPMFISTSLGS